MHRSSSHPRHPARCRLRCASPSSSSPYSLFYWALHGRELLRLPALANVLYPPHVHPITHKLCVVTLSGEMYVLRETPPIAATASPFLLQPLVEWEAQGRLVVVVEEGGESLFPLSPSSLFFTFHHTACISTAFALYFFSLPAGICIHRVPLPPSTSPSTAFLAAHGFSGTGAVLSTGRQLFSIVSSPISAQLTQLTSASPHADLRKRMEEEENGGDEGLPASDTFASPSFTSAFPSLSTFEPSPLPSSPSFGPMQSPLSVTPSTLIPSLPYPALSHLAAQVSATYGPSLQSHHQQQLLHRWMGMATASSPSHLSPPALPSAALPAPPDTLREALACLQSPALPLSMIVSPSSSHWLHGHVWDGEQTAVVREELDRWLHLIPLTSSHQPSQQVSTGIASPPTSADRSLDFYDRFTPLNVALHPLLASVSSTLSYLHSSASPSPSTSTSSPRPPALPSSLAIPPLPPLSSQLSRAITNRSSSHLSSKEPSLTSLTLSSPTPTFHYLRSLMGLDHLTPLPSTSSTPTPLPHPSPRVHPNMMLLNDEIRLKKELGVFGKDIPINTAGLQRSDAMPFVELLCRLYDELQPHMVMAFVRAVEGGGGGEGSAVGAKRWQRAIGERDLTRNSDRALQCLPTIRLRGEGVDIRDPVWMDRLLARAWLLKESARLCEAVELLLEAAEAADAEDVRSRCEEEAISLAYAASPENAQQPPTDATPPSSSDEDGEEEEEDDANEAEGEGDEGDSDCVRAELYHRLSSYFIRKATARVGELKGDGERGDEDGSEGRAALVEAALKGLDGRIRSLSPPHFSAQHMGLLLQQQLHQDDG